MSKLEFVIGFSFASDWMIYIIEILLDNHLGYCCCMGVPQAQVVSPSVQAKAHRSRRHGFSERGSCTPWVFGVHPLNLDRGSSGSDCGHPLKLDWNSGNSWADCGNIHWG